MHQFYTCNCVSCVCRELENRQNLEVEKRQQQIENKSLRNNLHQLESDVRDLKRALAEEQDARAMQNQLLEDERKKSEVLIEESRNHSLQKAEALSQLEAVDQTRKSYEVSSGSLREELKAAQVSVVKIDTVGLRRRYRRIRLQYTYYEWSFFRFFPPRIRVTVYIIMNSITEKSCT